MPPTGHKSRIWLPPCQWACWSAEQKISSRLVGSRSNFWTFYFRSNYHTRPLSFIQNFNLKRTDDFLFSLYYTTVTDSFIIACIVHGLCGSHLMGQHVLLKYIMFTLQLLVCCVGIFLKLIVKKKTIISMALNQW